MRTKSGENTLPRPKESLTCSCGEPLFHSDDLKIGAKLVCSSCDREYRYLGKDKIEPLDEELEEITTVGEVEEIKIEVPDAPEETEKNSPGAATNVFTVDGTQERFVHKAEEKAVTGRFAGLSNKMKAERERQERLAAKQNPDGKPEASTRKKGKGMQEVPGGVLPMVSFMAIFSALAFVGLAVLFPKLQDGTRDTFWGGHINLQSPWPDLIAVFAGQALGFGAWTIYVYFLVQKRKAAAAADAGDTEVSRQSVRKKVAAADDRKSKR